MKGKIIFFATGNIHKFNEARAVLAENGLAVAMIREKSVEIQNDSISEIASSSALEAYKKCHLPLIVEDAGLFVKELKGFPGPYAAYAYKTLGNSGLLKLMKDVRNRESTFRSVIAYCDSESVTCFYGESFGEITFEEKAKKGSLAFGFDPIFQPDKSEKTFAQMTLKEKNSCSHRAMAIQKFAEWYKRQI